METTDLTDFIVYTVDANKFAQVCDMYAHHNLGSCISLIFTLHSRFDHFVTHFRISKNAQKET